MEEGRDKVHEYNDYSTHFQFCIFMFEICSFHPALEKNVLCCSTYNDKHYSKLPLLLNAD